MKILIIGSGGREHAIAYKLSQSESKPELFVAPGNAGMSTIATCVPLAVDNLEGLLSFAVLEKIDLTIVGPELPLVLGIVDLFEAEGLKIFGPKRYAAQFEGSKDFTKAFLQRHHIPTAKSETHVDLTSALEALSRFTYPLVIKADGLAAGKGVIIAATKSEAETALSEIMAQRIFGNSGSKVVIEAFLKGIEASILCFVDGETILPMSPAQDYKKAMDGDEGLNTGGMGTYSPSQIIDETLMYRIQNEILNPFISGIKKDDIDFKGILFVGIMIDGDEINVLEYNVRMGDPETEVTLCRMENDLLEVIDAVLEKRLVEVKLRWSEQSAVCVIMASGGYPAEYEKDKVISGLEAVPEDVMVYHCGTKLDAEANILTNGGRVLGITAKADTLDAARTLAYQGVSKIYFEKMSYRTDIARF
ncbi:MAG: phosphoribosylamine--glycine ligase [Clostridiales bacterium 38-18]|nr:MAG: phosphoribosylamine--glycine ligase [Clostridiales bacterium 38-18]